MACKLGAEASMAAEVLQNPDMLQVAHVCRAEEFSEDGFRIAERAVSCKRLVPSDPVQGKGGFLERAGAIFGGKKGT